MTSGTVGKQTSFNIPVARPIAASDDQMAESEAAALAFDLDLKSADTAKKIRKLSNKGKIDGTVTTVLRIMIWAACILLLVSFFVLFYHFVMPDSWLFLAHERVVDLREFLFSGTFGAGLAALWKSQDTAEKDDQS